MRLNKAHLRTALQNVRGDIGEISGIALKVVLVCSIPAFTIAWLTAFNPIILSAILVVSWITLVFVCYTAGEYQELAYKDENIEPERTAEDNYDARTRARMPRDFDGQRIKHSQ